jgi:hypothetical protein
MLKNCQSHYKQNKFLILAATSSAAMEMAHKRYDFIKFMILIELPSFRRLEG